MQISMNNQRNITYQSLFDDLIQSVFDFSFSPWFERNLWDSRYESYSIIQNGQMLSNVSVFRTDMILYGKTFQALQFGAVATRECQRGKGFSRYLIEHVLQKFPEMPAFLTANASVIDFYPLFGFRRVQTYCPKMDICIDNYSIQAEKVTLDNELFQSYMSKRLFSHVVDTGNTQPVRMFHLLLSYSDHMYILPCGAIIVAWQDKEKLFLVDVMMQVPVTFETIRKEVPFVGIKHIEFGFCPDLLKIKPVWKPVQTNQKAFFIRGDWALPKEFCFPILSGT